jgi:hypothetical protein
MWSWIDWRSISRFMAFRTAMSESDGMLALQAGALALDLVPGVGVIHLDQLEAPALLDVDAALAARLERLRISSSTCMFQA